MAQGENAEEEGLFPRETADAQRYSGHCRTNRVSETSDSSYIKVLNAMQENGNALVVRGEIDVALDVFREVYEERRQLLGEDDSSTLSTRHQMAWTLMSQGNLNVALHVFHDVYDRSKRCHGDGEDLTLVARDNMAYVLSKMGRYAEALAIYKEVYELEVRLHGEDYKRNLVTKQSIAALHFHIGEHSVAMEMFRGLQEKMKDVFGKTHELTLKNGEFMDEIKRIKRSKDSCNVM